MSKNLFDKLGITQEELEKAYLKAGTLRALAEELAVSKTTLQKYLSHVAKDTKPWDAARTTNEQHNIDYLRRKHRKRAMEQVEQALLAYDRWEDVNGRVIPRDAIEIMEVHPPQKFANIVTIYARLRDGSFTIFVYTVTDQEQAEHSSGEGIHCMSLPTPSA